MQLRSITILRFMEIIFTQPALVRTRPWRPVQYSLKNCGIDIPRNRDNPVINRFLIEFMLVNCRNDRPTEPAEENGSL